jgi:hypothetical protein
MSTLKKILSKVTARRKLEPTKDVASCKPLVSKLEQNGYVPSLQNGTDILSKDLEGSSQNEESEDCEAKCHIKSRQLEAYEQVCHTLESY